MAAITIPGMFLTGDHASRPAANAVGKGALYACSTHALIYQSDGSSWATWLNAASGAVDPDLLDPYAIGVPMTYGLLGQQSQLGFTAGGANQCRYFRVIGSGTIDSIGIVIGSTTGNIGVAVYRKTGVGRDARPGTRLATTGSIASPGNGYQEIALGASVSVENGDFFALSASSGTITFATHGTGTAQASDMGLGFCMYQTSAHPPPTDNPTVTGGLDGWVVAMIGVVP